MISGVQLNHVLAAFSAARSIGSLHEALLHATALLGFSRFAMGHHIDLLSPVEDAIRLTSYDEGWISHILDRGYFADDPIHLASTRSPCGFAWSDVGRYVRLTARHRQILTEAVGFGLTTGFTVPVHVPGEYQGTCSFAAETSDQLHENSFAFAQVCGPFAFAAARRIMRKRIGLEEGAVPALTPRQLEALLWVGRGKNDSEIGEILGVSRATAHEHVEGARRAYGNAQRPFLIARALFDGQLAFTDLLRR